MSFGDTVNENVHESLDSQGSLAKLPHSKWTCYHKQQIIIMYTYKRHLFISYTTYIYADMSYSNTKSYFLPIHILC